jgi:hypothetical protein
VVSNSILEEREHLALFVDIDLDIRDYLTCDLKLSDTALNDLFSDFDMNTNDFQSYDNSIQNISYLQIPLQNTLSTSMDLPPPYDVTLLSASVNTTLNTRHVPTVPSRLDGYLSTNTNNPMLEQQASQSVTVKYLSSPSPTHSMHSANFSEVNIIDDNNRVS